MHNKLVDLDAFFNKVHEALELMTRSVGNLSPQKFNIDIITMAIVK